MQVNDISSTVENLFKMLKSRKFMIANIVIGFLAVCFLTVSFIFEKSKPNIFFLTLLSFVLCIAYFVFFGIILLFLGAYLKANKTHGNYNKEIAENEIKNSLFQLNFTTTNSVGFDKSKILIDNTSKQWCIQSNTGNRLSVSNIMKFTDILSFEIMDNSSTVYKTKVEGGITRAIVGGALFGGVGALVGANTAGSSTRSQTNHSYRVLFMVNDLNNPTISFDCLNDLNMAKQVAATFEVIKYNN